MKTHTNNEITIKRKNTYSMKIKSSGKDTVINVIKKEKKLYIKDTKADEKEKLHAINLSTYEKQKILTSKNIPLKKRDKKIGLQKSNTTNNIIKTRPPIITILGHVDHGKTTLLNYIKNTKHIPHEHGGITQHINAYEIETKYGIMIFLDTPGHFAFNSTRQRGVQHTDIVVLVIAADDGVMPQTIEAINLAKNNNVPIIVAINKVDKSTDKNEKIINDLSNHNLIPESWGGETLFSYISAKTGFGVDNLLETISLQTEMLDLKTDYTGPVDGIIIDSRLDLGKGHITTVIIIKGCLKKGDIGLTGTKWGKIKSITNSLGKEIDEAYPTMPVEITGIPGPINIEEKFITVLNEKQAKYITESKIDKKIQNKTEYHLESLMIKMKKEQKNKINIIIKTDVQGSTDVIKSAINNLSINTIEINTIKTETGNINKSDIDLAIATNATIIGFNIKIDAIIKKMAQTENVTVKYFNVIYEITDYIKDIIHKKSFLNEEEIIIGIAEVKKIFNYEKTKTIAGCNIISGRIKKNSLVKVFRQDIFLYKGTIDSIKVFKANVPEIKSGNECGLIVKNFNNIQISDIIKAYS
ncbi:MAG TPA: translation initiation factor IF-2 [Candidatus Azoamicus sp. OHIO1]